MAHLSTNDLNIYKIARTLGHATFDLGQLCLSVKNNPFSKYKPIGASVSEQIPDSTYASEHYGLVGKAFNNRDSLFNADLSWTYSRPSAPYLRIRDFYRYFHDAKPCMMQAMGSSFTLDLVQLSPGSLLFYLLFNSGALANKPFSKDGGINTNSVNGAVDSSDLAYNIAVEDVVFDMGGNPLTLLDANYPSYLGVVIFTTAGAFVQEIFSTYPIANGNTYQADMFRISAASLNLNVGEYVAVACAKQVQDSFTYYLPVHGTSWYPARFTLSVGGISNYKALNMGIATSAVGIFVTSLTTTQSDIFVKVRLYNYSGKSLTIQISGNTKFQLEVAVTGSVVDSQTEETVNINRTQTALLSTDYNSNDLTIADKGYGDLVYKITNIWSNSSSSGATAINSGQININPVLKFRGTTAFPNYRLTPMFAVNYGA